VSCRVVVDVGQWMFGHSAITSQVDTTLRNNFVAAPLKRSGANLGKLEVCQKSKRAEGGGAGGCALSRFSFDFSRLGFDTITIWLCSGALELHPRGLVRTSNTHILSRTHTNRTHSHDRGICVVIRFNRVAAVVFLVHFRGRQLQAGPLGDEPPASPRGPAAGATTV
jgi:hypothetical protein